MVNDTRAYFGHTEKKACNLIGISRSSYRYIPQLPCDDTLKERMRDLAYKKPRYGVRRLHVLLKKEGLVVNHKKTERIYRQEGLAIRIKTKKKLPPSVRLTLCVPVRINQQWAIDFVHDNIGSGRRFRCLSLLDVYSRECLAIHTDTSISGKTVTDILQRFVETRGAPEVITTDNGPEFTSKVFTSWAYEKGIRIFFIRPGKPMENAFVESFQGKLRDECLNLNWFNSLTDAQKRIESWRLEYNTERPHSSLDDLSPFEFINRQMVLTG
jgi:putative transposase